MSITKALDLVNRRNLAFMCKQRLGVEMFKIIKGSYSNIGIQDQGFKMMQLDLR